MANCCKKLEIWASLGVEDVFIKRIFPPPGGGGGGGVEASTIINTSSSSGGEPLTLIIKLYNVSNNRKY